MKLILSLTVSISIQRERPIKQKIQVQTVLRTGIILCNFCEMGSMVKYEETTLLRSLRETVLVRGPVFPYSKAFSPFPRILEPVTSPGSSQEHTRFSSLSRLRFQH